MEGHAAIRSRLAGDIAFWKTAWVQILSVKLIHAKTGGRSYYFQWVSRPTATKDFVSQK